jgi:hypothetical protein
MRSRVGTQRRNRLHQEFCDFAMGFDLSVTMPRRPANLRGAWERALAAHGFEVEIFPTFDPATHGGGVLPFRVVRVPHPLVGMKLDRPAVAAFEVRFDADGAHLWTGVARTTLDFALQCVGAAALAELVGGEYVDHYSGVVYPSAEAFAVAEREVRSFVASAGEDELATQPFPGWSALT